jgi:hypothetical protein
VDVLSWDITSGANTTEITLDDALHQAEVRLQYPYSSIGEQSWIKQYIVIVRWNPSEYSADNGVTKSL